MWIAYLLPRASWGGNLPPAEHGRPDYWQELNQAPSAHYTRRMMRRGQQSVRLRSVAPDSKVRNRQKGPRMTMDRDDVTERLHKLEVAQATQAATEAGAVATLTATQAGAAATTAAAQAGTVATTAAAQAGTIGTMVAGSVGFIVGIFLGLAISNAHKH